MTAGLTDSDSTASGESLAPHSTMRRDLIWAYVASGSKIASWAIVSAIVYRKAGKLEFAMLSMVRGNHRHTQLRRAGISAGDGAAARRIARGRRSIIGRLHLPPADDLLDGHRVGGDLPVPRGPGDGDLRSFLFTIASSPIAIDLAGATGRPLDRHRHDAARSLAIPAARFCKRGDALPSTIACWQRLKSAGSC